MAAYDYACTACGWKGTLYQVRIAEADAQTCPGPEGRGEETAPCGALLKRSDEIPSPNFQIDASGGGYMGVSRSGQPIKGQFGGGHMQKRRFKP